MHQSRGEPKIENHYSYLLSGVPILSVVLIPGPSYPWFESSSSRLVPSPSSLLPVFKGWLIIALYSLAACYCLTCTRLGYRPSSRQGGWGGSLGTEVRSMWGKLAAKLWMIQHNYLMSPVQRCQRYASLSHWSLAEWPKQRGTKRHWCLVKYEMCNQDATRYFMKYLPTSNSGSWMCLA